LLSVIKEGQEQFRHRHHSGGSRSGVVGRSFQFEKQPGERGP